MKNEKRKLIYINQEDVAQTRSATEKALPLIQAVIDEAAKIQVEVTPENIADAIRGPVEFCHADFQRDLESEPVVTAGRLTKKTRSLESYELPNLEAFSSACEAFRKFRVNNPVMMDVIEWHMNRVVIDEGKWDEAVKSMGKYIDTDIEHKWWNLLTRYSDIINEINEEYKKDSGSAANHRERINLDSTAREILEFERGEGNRFTGKLTPQIFVFNELIKHFVRGAAQAKAQETKNVSKVSESKSNITHDEPVS